MPNFISEDAIEKAILNRLKEQFGFELLNCHTSDADDLNDRSGRSDKREVILRERLKDAAVRLNPGIPQTPIDEALARLTDKRHAMSPIAANREIDGLIRDGIPVEFENAQGKKEKERVRVIDFDPGSGHNRFLAVSQLWIKGERNYRRPDILLYVNGIPLVFIELKNSNVKLKAAFDDNLTTYRKEIPQLFLFNAFCILSNAVETKVGSFNSPWGFFFKWLRVESEKEKVNREKIKSDGTSVELAVAGLCSPTKLLDYLENFIIYHKETEKIISQNHQFIGVNNAFRAFLERKKQEGLDKPPVREKSERFRLLDEAVQQGLAFCLEKDIDLAEVMDVKQVFKNIGRFTDFADILLGNEEWRKSFNVYENTITSLYEAAKPEILGKPAVRFVAVFQYLRGVIDSIIEQKDIDKVSIRISELLDESVVVDNAEKFMAGDHRPEYQIVAKGKKWDLSKTNFDKLREDFKQASYKNIEIADLRAFVENKLQLMLEQNLTRIDFAQRLQQIIDTYNAGGSSNEKYFDELLKFTRELREEDERAAKEGLTEDELELFDLLKKDKMTKAEEQKVKLAAKALLNRLLKGQPKVLVQDWFKDSQTQKRVRAAVEQVLDKKLPESYNRVLFKKKCDAVFEAMLNYASNGQKWAA